MDSLLFLLHPSSPGASGCSGSEAHDLGLRDCFFPLDEFNPREDSSCSIHGTGSNWSNVISKKLWSPQWYMIFKEALISPMVHDLKLLHLWSILAESLVLWDNWGSRVASSCSIHGTGSNWSNIISKKLWSPQYYMTLSCYICDLT